MMDKLSKLRQEILRMSHKGQAGHIPSAFSILEIIWALYDQILQPDDRFILSKGHGALALYAVLGEKGFITKKDLEQFARPGGILGGHPGSHISGIEFATGSLGHGLAAGCGMALAKKSGQQPGKIYVLIGDGECQEGAVWEAAAVIAKQDLDVVCIIDNNYTHADTALASKFSDLGWNYDIVDGHNIPQIIGAIRDKSCPLVIIASTIKGHGSATIVKDSEAWHHRSPNVIELEELLAEVG